MRNKKAISPLIVTVLLIGFAIALAAIVMTWGTEFIRETQEDVSGTAKKSMTCVGLNLGIKGYDCTSGILTIGNDNDFAIVKLTFRTYDSVGNILPTQPSDVGTEMDPALESLEAKGFQNIVSSGVGKVEVIPTLEGGVVCSSTPISKTIKCGAMN